MSSQNLLPCPFCGDTDVSINCIDEVFRYVECTCGAHGPVRGTEDEDEEHGHDYAKAAERDAIAAWNAAPRYNAELDRFTEPAEPEIVDDGTGRTREEVNATIDGVVAAAAAIEDERVHAAIWNDLSDTQRDLLLFAYQTRDRSHDGVLDVAGSGAGWHRTARSLADRHKLFVCAHPGGPGFGEWRLTELGMLVAAYGDRQPKPTQKRRTR